MAGRLENVRDLKLELPDETSAPARPDVEDSGFFWQSSLPAVRFWR